MAEGQAVVLDNPKDPMGILLTQQRGQQQNAIRQQQMALQQRKASDADMNKTLAYKYEDPGERFRSWGQDAINKANQDVMSIYQSNPNADNASLKSNILAVQGRTQKDLNYAKEINNIYNEKIQTAGNIKNIDKEAFMGLMNSTIAKNSPYEVDRDILENIEQVPKIYDLNSLVAGGVADIKNQFRKVTPGEMQSSPLGLFMEVTDNKMRFKDIDKTMDYILRGDDVTDVGLNQKMNGGLIDDRIRWGIAEQEVSRAGGNPNDLGSVMNRFKQIQYDPKYAPQVRGELKGILEQLNQEDRSVKVQSMGKFKQQSFGDDLKENRLMLRDQNLKNILNPFDANGTTPKKESQAAVSRLLGGDFAGGKVTGAKYEKGNMTTDPAWVNKIGVLLNRTMAGDENAGAELQQAIREAKNHQIQRPGNKIKLTVKTGTLFGQPETLSDLPLDLTDPNAEAILNALMNGNKGEANIPLDDVMFFRNKGKQRFLDDDDSDGDGFLDEDEDSGFLDD